MLREHTCSFILIGDLNMSDYPRKGPFEPAVAAFGEGLATFVGIYMDSKVQIAKKLLEKIAQESDPNKLLKLSAQMNDILLSEKDIKQLGLKMETAMKILQKAGADVITLREKFRKEARDAHP